MRCKKVISSLGTLVIAANVVCSAQTQAQMKAETVRSHHGAAVQTLRRYVQLRLENADWNDYSKLVTWPDEPSWDCNWVVAKYEVDAPKQARDRVVVPVLYHRIGLFCYDFDFKPESRTVTVNYELVGVDKVWKVDGPVPDYPDVSADVLLRSLRASAQNAAESSERRAQFSATARKLADVLSVSRPGGLGPRS